MSQERDQVIAAIKSLGRRVTVSDVAAKTGLPLLSTTRQLNCVAADCKGTLEVTSDGNIVYAFKAAFDSAYLKSGIARKLQVAADAIFQGAYYLLRISFGITLIASMITVAVLIIVAVIAMISKGSDGGDSGGSGGGGGGDLNLDWLGDIGQFFCWSIPYRDYSYNSWGNSIGYSQGAQPGGTSYVRSDASADAYKAYTEGRYVPEGDKAGPKQGFVMNCFSYLFGDGNPNEKIEEYKWQVIAEYIRRNSGVSTAEELTCFTGGNPEREYDALPVLVRFDGQPMVTESGNIIYVFPSMQLSTSSAQQVLKQPGPLPQFLSEKRWPFSLQPLEAFIPVTIFACLNFAGCLWLFEHISKISVLHHYRYLIDWLTVYGVFFIAFPLIRYAGLLFVNAKIKIRNDKRQANYQLLQSKAQKLAEARVYAIALDTASANNIVYSTDKDILDQQFADGASS